VARADVRYVVGTGYGRINLCWTDDSVTEIRCHARGASHWNPDARTVVDIGGQDSKAIALGPGGQVLKFLMNDKCAAGCGRFIESILKHALDTSIYELDEWEIDLTQASNINSTCTVFAESEVIGLLAEGTPKEQIIGGLVKAIASRVGNLAKKVGIKEKVVFSGGVAKNKGVLRSLEQVLGVTVHSFNGHDPQLVGALGAALIARERFLASVTPAI
jgi:predicted CoA-substrate-specific enzyme activase